MSQPMWWTYFRAIAGTEDGQTIATAAGVTPSQVSRWKTGKNRPSADQVINFARHYERPPVEALMSTGYLRHDELGAHVELSSLPTQDLDDQELVDEIARRLAVRVATYERTLVQILVAVGQLQTYVEAIADGYEEDEVSDVGDHLGVLTFTLHRLAAFITADPSRLKRMIAEAAIELRSRQIGHVKSAARDDLVSQISAWPFDYSNIRQLQTGIEYVRDDEIIRKRKSASSAETWRITASGNLVRAPEKDEPPQIPEAARTAPIGYQKGRGEQEAAAEENQE